MALYSKALASELDCTEEEQDTVHAAGLLEEIGKFTWPDRVLHAQVVAEQDMEIVRSHPQEGAVLVGALDGYGPVADAILYHHERVDGRGYPAGLIGKEIPLASRILAICSIYDTMTARESYRSSEDEGTLMTPEEAMQELRNSSRPGSWTETWSRPSSRCSNARARPSPTMRTSRRTRLRAPGPRDGRAEPQPSPRSGAGQRSKGRPHQ